MSKSVKILLVAAVLLLTSVATVVKWLLPYLIFNEASKWYSAQGPDYKMEIEAIAFEPLSGVLSLSDLRFEFRKETHHLRSVYIDISMMSLLSKKLVVESVKVDDVSIDLNKQGDKHEILGILIPKPEANNDTSTAQESSQTESKWHITVRELMFSHVTISGKDEHGSIEIDINELTVKGAEHLSDLTVIVDTTIRKLEYGDSVIELSKPLSIYTEGKIAEFRDDAYWKGRLILKDMDLIGNKSNRLQFEILTIDGVTIKSDMQEIESIDFEKLAVNEKLLAIDRFRIEQISHKNNELSIAKQIISDMISIIELDESNRVKSLASDSKDDKTSIQNESQTSAESNEAFHFSISNIQFKGSNIIEVHNPNLDPRLDMNMDIQELEITDINNKGEKSKATLKMKFDEYSELVSSINFDLSTGDYHAKANLDQFNLIVLNGYIEKSIGYHVDKGLAHVDLDIASNSSQLKGKVNLKINNIDLIPTDKAAIERMSKRISMPLDTALSLLTDDKNNLTLSIPVSGNMNDPDFGVNDLIYILSKKALKAASVNYLLQAFFPYGLIVSAVDYAGKDLFSIKLEPIQVIDDELSDENIKYLTKVVEIMNKKTDLQLHVCPQQDKLNEGKDWKKMALNDADMIKSALFKMEKSLSARIAVCEPKLADKTEVLLGF